MSASTHRLHSADAAALDCKCKGHCKAKTYSGMQIKCRVERFGSAEALELALDIASMLLANPLCAAMCFYGSSAQRGFEVVLVNTGTMTRLRTVHVPNIEPGEPEYLGSELHVPVTATV